MATNPAWVNLITASLGGLLTLAGVMITQRYTRLREDVRWTRERLTDLYLEVLRLVEREAQWFEASTENWKIYAVNYDYELGVPRVEMPERAVTDRATIAAHLTACGSANVGTLHQTWRSTITSIENVHHSWNGNVIVNGEPPSFDNMEHVETELHRKERDARQALGDAIAKELGHR